MARLSKGNSKIGKCPNISLPPVITCPADVPCKRDCYAIKAWHQYPNVRECWGSNWQEYQADSVGYFESIIDQLKGRKALKNFRWHVAGDIPDQLYFEGMKRVAAEISWVNFLCYTKNYGLDFKDIPDNLRLVLSAWPGRKLSPKMQYFSVAWLSHDKRIKQHAKEKLFDCNDSCEACGMICFKGDSTFDVVFIKH